MVRTGNLKSYSLWLCIILALSLAACGNPEESGRVSSKSLEAAEHHGGNWQAEGEIVTQDQVMEKAAIFLVGKEELSRYSVQVEMRLRNVTPGAKAGLVFQARDPANYLYFTLENRRGGPFAALGIEAVAATKRFQDSPLISKVFCGDQSRHKDLDLEIWHDLRVDVRGAEAVCFLDGKPAATYWYMGTPPPYDAFGQLWPQDPDHGRVGLMTVNSSAQFRNLSVEPLSDAARLVTPLRGKRDANGILLPQQSYAETMKRLNEWMIHSGEVVDRSKAPEPIQGLPPYLLTNFMAADDRLWALGGEYGFNHSITIIGAIQYYCYSADERALNIAREIADWHLANRTPADWKVPHLVPSVVQFQPDGSWKGMDWGLELDKSAYMGLALLKLHAATGEQKYLEAAKEMAEVLRGYQREDGSWPFRIDAKTGKVTQSYSCSQLWYVWLFEKLSDLTGNSEDRKRSRKALAWLLQGPVKDNRWFGIYGDVPIGAESYDQWVPLETAMYLIDRRDEIPGAVRKAEDLLAWIRRTLVVDYGFHPDVPGLLEQSSFPVVETIQEFRLAELYAKLYEATGNPDYRKSAIQSANSTTWCQMSDGKIRQGMWYISIDCPMVLSYNSQLCRIMGCVPETAPRNENHLLQNTSDLTHIAYERDRVLYRTIGPGAETLITRSRPREILAGNLFLPRLHEWGFREDGWWYDDATSQLRIRHGALDVEVKF